MVMDIYEVELCRRGRWEQQDARFVAAGDAGEAAYKVARAHLHSEGDRRRIRLRVRRLGNGSPRRSCFTLREAASGRKPTTIVFAFVTSAAPGSKWLRKCVLVV